jgi:FAD/FMN-containing dehydrogenase
MNQVLEIDEKLTVTVQAGITIWELNEVLAQGTLASHQPESKEVARLALALLVTTIPRLAFVMGKSKTV